MPRIGFVLTATALAAINCALAGCSALMFARLPQTPSPPSSQTLQFQSEPTGANVQTVQGQTCQTPCSLALPVTSQFVTIAKNGFLSQIIQISVDQPPSGQSFFSKRPPPTLTPNPIRVVLQIAPPPPDRPAPPPSQLTPPPTQPAPPPSNMIPWFPS
jgi:PEGA domain